MHLPDPKYFDYAASSPPYAEALSKLVEISGSFYANPSSIHWSGVECHNKLIEIKNQFSDLLGFKDGRLLLCSSGTEANNTIIEGHIKKNPDGRILIAEDVHDCIWYAHTFYNERVDILKIDESGNINSDQLKSSLKSNTTLVCVNHVCNETGMIQEVSSIAGICYNRGIKLLIDGVQAIGHIPVNLDLIPCDYYTFSSHKFGGPRGSGGIFIRDNKFEPLLHGGRQEWQLRAGTENLGGLAASLEALNMSLMFLEEESIRLGIYKSLLLNSLRNKVSNYIINSPSVCLPGFVSISFPQLSGSEIVTGLSLSGFSVSTGSACHANQVEPSRIILALGRSRQEAIGNIRISMGRGTTEWAVNELSDALIDFVK